MSKNRPYPEPRLPLVTELLHNVQRMLVDHPGCTPEELMLVGLGLLRGTVEGCDTHNQSYPASMAMRLSSGDELEYRVVPTNNRKKKKNASSLIIPSMDNFQF